MVAQNADIGALLAKLSKTKPLPKATQAFVTPQQQVQMQIRDAVIENVRRAPTLQESLNTIAQGGYSPSNPALGVAAKVFGNPIVKTALAPIIAFDTGRRGIISAAREVTDMLDNDPNTKASFSDFAKQTKDFTYGYGKAFPMEGWGGRIVGFIGDVVLDPLTYATLGSAVPAAATLRGATSTGLRVTTRQALGAARRTGVAAKVLGEFKPVRIFSAEARFNLAKVVGDQARRINLLDDAEAVALGLTKRTESQIQVIEQLVAKFGKTRVPQDIARDIGLPKAGIYWFGSRVKLPLSGAVGHGLELMLAGTRTKITGRTTGAIGRWMDSITAEGVPSDKIGVKRMRRALVTGKVTPEEASTYLKLLDDNRQRRVLHSMVEQEYQRRFKLELANDPLIQANRETLYEFLENPQKYEGALPDVKAAADKVHSFSNALADEVEQAMKLVDPGFEMRRIKNYFPHQMTQQAMDYMDDLRNPFVEQLRVYLHTDLADPAAAFKHRGLQNKSPFFGHILTEQDIAQGVKRLNSIAKLSGAVDFDFFETDVLKAFSKYGNSYASEIARANFLKRITDTGVLKMLGDKGIYDSETLKALELGVRESVMDVSDKIDNVQSLAKNLESVIGKQLDTLKSTQKDVVQKAKGAVAAAKTATKASAQTLNETKRAIDTIVDGLEKLGVKDAVERLEMYGISGILPEMVIDAPLANILGRLDELTTGLRTFNEMLATGQKTLDDFAAELPNLKKAADQLAKEAKGQVEKLAEFESIHAVLGDFVNGKYSDLLMESAEEGGGETLVKVVQLMKDQTLRDKVGLTRTGRIVQKNIERLWGTAAGQKDTRVVVLQRWLDPNNKITIGKLKTLTIEKVRDIISQSTIKVNSMQDLRHALTWLVIRDLDRSPTLFDSLVTSLTKEVKDIPVAQGNTLADLLHDNGTISRIAKIKETISALAEKEEIINNVARKSPTAKQYGVKEIVEKQGEINILTEQINTWSADFALLEGGPEAMPLRVWRQVSVDKPNEIVTDANIIEDLFNNIRTVTRTAFVSEYVDGNKFRTGLEMLDSVPISRATEGEAAIRAVDLGEAAVNALKDSGIENQKLTYRMVENLLEDYANQLLDVNPDVVTKFQLKEDIADAIRTRDKLIKDIHEKTAAINTKDRATVSAELDPRTYTEAIMEYSNQALEYYIYSETKAQFNSLMDELAPYGVKPSYGVYQRLLGDISKRHIVKVKQFETQLDAAEKILQNIDNAVQQHPANLQPIILREKLLEALNDETFEIGSRSMVKDVLDSVFPEIRLTVQKTKISDLSRLQARDEILLEQRQNILTLLRRYDRASGQGKASQRGGILRGTGTAGEQAQAVPGAPSEFRQLPKSQSLAPKRQPGAPIPNQPQANIELIINQLESSTANINMSNLIKNARVAMRWRMSEKEFINFTTELQPIEDAIATRIDQLKLVQKQQKELRKAAGAPAGTRAALRQETAVRRASKENYNAGLSGLLSNALNGSGSRRVRDFFGNLYGGQVKDPSRNDIWAGVYRGYSGGKIKTLRKGPKLEPERAATRTMEAYKQIKTQDSIIGTMSRKLSERAAALRATTDFDYPIDTMATMGSVLPTLTSKDAGLKSVYGVKAYAELLRDRAKEIEQTILDNATFVARIRQIDKELDKTSSVPLEWQRLEHIKNTETAVKGTTAFRISPQTSLDGLPPGLRKKIIEVRKLKIEAAQIMASQEYLTASHEQTLMQVLHELADIDAWRIVNTDGTPGLYFNESGLTPIRTWNAPRPGELPGLDSMATVRYAKNLGNRNAQPTVHAIKEEPFRLANMELGNPHRIYLLPDGTRITEKNVLTLSKKQDFSVVQIRELHLVQAQDFKQNTLPGKKVYLDFESQIFNDKPYDPNKTWMRMPAESSVVGASKTAYEDVVTKPALEEVWVPITDVVDVLDSGTPLLANNFTAIEWEALFVPGPIQEKGRLQLLNSQKNKFDQQRRRYAELARATNISKQEKTKVLNRYDRAQKGYDNAVRELALYKARTSARAKLNQLVRVFEKPETAELLGVTVKKGKQPTAAEVAQAYVQKQLEGVDVRGNSVLADETIGVAEARRDALKTDWAKSGNAKVMNRVKQIQKSFNNVVLKDYSNNLSLQYQNYVDVLDELVSITNDWTKAAATVKNAKLITRILDEPKVRAVVPEQRALSDIEISNTLEEEIKRLLTAGDAKTREQALALIEAHNQNLKQSADVVRGIANQLDTAPPQAPLEVLPDAPQIKANIQQNIIDKTAEADRITRQIQDLEFDQVLKEKSIGEIEKVVKEMTSAERALLAAKAKHMSELAKIDQKRLDLINKALNKASVGKKGKNPVDRLTDLSVTHSLAVASYNQARHLESLGDNALQNATTRLELIQEIANSSLKGNLRSKELEWVPEFVEWYSEATDLIKLMSNGKLPKKTQNVITAFVDGVNALELSKASLSIAEASAAAERGMKQMFDETGIGANMLIKQLEKGYEYLNKDAFPSIMVKQAYAEILRNANSFRDPIAGVTLTRMLKRWNSYWKPLATSTPGFHVRNNVANIMAAVFGGAKIANLPEASSVGIKWMESIRNGISWDDFLRTLTPEEQTFATTARWAVAASGGGVYTDVPLADNFVQRNPYIALNKKFAYDSDSFARFVFSYDAAMQGFSPEQAAMRTKRFYVDYEDVSSLDKMLRQVIPFWMWTSRNVVTQVQNMWTNPKPYLIYNSFVRNFRDQDDNRPVSKAWRELQTFKLPFGKDLYAMPDLGFLRVQQQLELAKTPTRFLGDISPAIRMPFETVIAGKQFYNERPFKKTPIQVEGAGLGSALQPLAQLIGMGETNQQGQRFINEKLLYALTSLLPPASIAERLMPSTGSNAGGFNRNTLAGLFGVPIKQHTPEMEKNELLRRLFEIQDAASRVNALNNP